MRTTASCCLVFVLIFVPALAHAQSPAPLSLSPSAAPSPAWSPTGREAAASERARHRVATGRALTWTGAGALVLALGVGVPLISASYTHSDVTTNATMTSAGVTLTSIFGAIAGVALTVGPVLWQTGAADEAALRDGGLYARYRRRRIIGVGLLTVAALAEIGAVVGSVVAIERGVSCHHDACGGWPFSTTDEALIFGSAGVALAGFTSGGLLVASAANDRKLTLSLAPGGLTARF
jgi:hypothetical protein